MGGLIGKNNPQNKNDYIKANKTIGRESRCDTCGKFFSPQTHINQFSNHIKNCYQINRERNRLENLLNELRETNFEIEQLERNKQKKKEDQKKIKREKTFKNPNNLYSNRNQILVNSPDLIFFGPNIILNNEINNHVPGFNFYSKQQEDNFNDYENSSEIDFDTLKNLPFEEKLLFFRSFAKKLKVDWREGSCTLEIDRDDCLRQSMIQFEKIDTFKELKINFRGEVSHDAGGLIREWYSIIFKYLQSPDASKEFST